VLAFLFIHHLQNWRNSLVKNAQRQLKIQGLQWDPKKKLEESSMLMMIYTEEGNLELATNTTDKHDENLAPKLHISSKLYS